MTLGRVKIIAVLLLSSIFFCKASYAIPHKQSKKTCKTLQCRIDQTRNKYKKKLKYTKIKSQSLTRPFNAVVSKYNKKVTPANTAYVQAVSPQQSRPPILVSSPVASTKNENDPKDPDPIPTSSVDAQTSQRKKLKDAKTKNATNVPKKPLSPQFETRYIKISGGWSKPINSIQYPQYGRKEKFNRALTGSAAFGLQLNRKFSIDVSATYSQYSFFDTSLGVVSSQKIDNVSFLLNGNLILYHGNIIEPYLTAGAGLAINKMGDFVTGITLTDINGNTHVLKQFGKIQRSFTWRAGFGIAFNISQNSKIDLSYRYSQLGKYSSSDVTNGGALASVPLETGQRLYSAILPLKVTQRAHNIMMGIIYYF